MNKEEKIYVAGHGGMVGSAICRLLIKKGFTNVIGKRSSQLDLRNQAKVNAFFLEEKPVYVIIAAAKVGGIHANNSFKADFLLDNLLIQTNLIQSSKEHGCKKLLFLGSSCIYPKLSPQPIKEEYLLTGPLEPTNEPYAIAKIAGIKLCDTLREQYSCDFISAMPTNLYGPNDNYNLQTSHVLPALLRKFHEAKLSNQKAVTMWGTGSPKREFLHVDDLAEACFHLMENYSDYGPVNIGTGEDISILEVAEMIKRIVGFKGEILSDTTKPDGTPRKLLDVSKINQLGWKYRINLQNGLESTYQDFISNKARYNVPH